MNVVRHRGLTFDRDDVVLARAAWSRLAEPGDVRVAALIEQVGPSEALRALVSRDVDWLDRYVPRLADLDPRRDLETLRRCGGRLVHPGCDEWPQRLGELAAPPTCLWVRGPVDLRDVEQRSVAVVGARASTAYGEHVTGEIACGVADRGFVVVSGLAYGVDGAAHRASMTSGRSVAVVAGGVDRAYPQGHHALMTALVDDGAVVSEVPPGSAPTRSRFLQRNRLIAAMSTGTVVVEAARAQRRAQHGAHRCGARAARRRRARPGDLGRLGRVPRARARRSGGARDGRRGGRRPRRAHRGRRRSAGGRARHGPGWARRGDPARAGGATRSAPAGPSTGSRARPGSTAARCRPRSAASRCWASPSGTATAGDCTARHARARPTTSSGRRRSCARPWKGEAHG